MDPLLLQPYQRMMFLLALLTIYLPMMMASWSLVLLYWLVFARNCPLWAADRLTLTIWTRWNQCPYFPYSLILKEKQWTWLLFNIFRYCTLVHNTMNWNWLMRICHTLHYISLIKLIQVIDQAAVSLFPETQYLFPSHFSFFVYDHSHWLTVCHCSTNHRPSSR